MGNLLTIGLDQQVKNNSSTPPASYSIGDNAQGGIIAYIFQSGDPGYDAGVQHGYVIQETDNATTPVIFGCAGTLFGATGTAMGTGANNTSIMAAGCSTSNSVCYMASNLSLNGYSDWFVPSKDEMTKIYSTKDDVGRTFTSPYYWTSSEKDAGLAWYINWSNGGLSADYGRDGTIDGTFGIRQY